MRDSLSLSCTRGSFWQAFNLNWARRVLNDSGVIILISYIPSLNIVLYRDTPFVEKLVASSIISIRIIHKVLKLLLILRRIKFYSTGHIHILSCILIQNWLSEIFSLIRILIIVPWTWHFEDTTPGSQSFASIREIPLSQFGWRVCIVTNHIYSLIL